MAPAHERADRILLDTRERAAAASSLQVVHPHLRGQDQPAQVRHTGVDGIDAMRRSVLANLTLTSRQKHSCTDCACLSSEVCMLIDICGVIR